MVLPKQMRLKGYRCFNYIYKEGKRFYGNSMVLRITNSNPNLLTKKNNFQNPNYLKCAISISNKVSKKAVVRNRLRRLFHQHLSVRFSKIKFGKEIWAFISLNPSCMKMEPSKLLNECDYLLSKAGLIKWLLSKKMFFMKVVLRRET